MKQPICPKCSREYVRRVGRVGLKEGLLGIFYIYPFKCQICGYRFQFLQWGVRYVRVAEDRRVYDRLPISFPLSFSGNPNIAGQGEAIDISMGGCSFNTTETLAAKMILRFELRISNDVPPVVVDAAIVRFVKSQNVGVEFLRCQKNERERLQLFISGLLIGQPT